VSALNVRIDPGTAVFLERLARESGRSRSEVVREALETLRSQSARRKAAPPAEAMAHLIGCWDSGGKRLSERTGEHFAQMLRGKTNGRHAGRRRSAGRPD
jgi:Arc/MetJ-type ribon-helix-helix transcriptional regulator